MAHGPFYIIDKFSSYQKRGRRGNPESLHLSGNWENRQYAEHFHNQTDAEKLLSIWKTEYDFKGRVIDHQTAMEMGDDD